MYTKTNNRIVEWDIAKAIAIVGMIFVHCKIAMINPEVHPIYAFITEFFGSPVAAPVFMFLLGACIPFSKHNDSTSLFKKGIKFFSLSYVFNLLVFSLPYVYRSFFFEEPLKTHSFLMLLFSSDILGFAGLTFIFFSTIKKMKLNWQHLLLILAIFIALNKILLAYCPIENSIFLQLIFGPFYGTHPDSYFPFLSWIGYPVAGYIFSTKIYSVKSKEKVYKNLGLLGVFIFITFTIFSVCDSNESYYNIFNPETGDDGRFYWHGLFTYLMFLGWIFFELWLCFLISKIIKGKTLKQLQRWSKNVTLMYVISYVPIFIIDVTIYNEKANLSSGYALLISLMIFCLSDLLSVQYRKIRLR